MMKEGLIVLDESGYLRVEDYEVEFEVRDLEIGEGGFRALLEEFEMGRRDRKNKVVRF
ncbi:CYTH domain-containing protein, partial [Bacillus altitudinis]|uniref:CYTH domain-containing protein n=1 Tax=Bacillus altitudinis TaxID=293387 RepID=UPI00307E631C